MAVPRGVAPAQPPVSPAVEVRLVPGSLNTTLVPTALPGAEAQDLLNCDTGRGCWELDKRHRRFLVPPRTGAESCSTPFGPASGSSLARTGSTDAWTNPNNVTIGAPVASTTTLGAGDKTEWLVAEGAPPSPLLPTGVALTSVTAFARIRLGTQYTVQYGAKIDTAELWVGGTLRGTALPNVVLTTDWQDVPIEFPGGVATATEINGGDWEIRLGCVAGPGGSETLFFSWSLYQSGWQPTGVMLSAGQTVTITGSGSGTWDGAIVCTPDGSPSYPTGGSGWTTPALALYNSPPFGANYRRPFSMLGAIGNPGWNALPAQTKQLGTAAVIWTPGTAGELHLGMDDVEGAYVDNTGSYTAKIETAPTESTVVEVEQITLVVCHGAFEDAAGPPDGILYSSYDGDEEIAVVHGQYAFTAPGDPGHALANLWSDDLAPTPLAPGPWILWAFDGKVFYTSPAGGVWYRAIGSATPMLPLYRDVQSPGTSGTATFQSDAGWIDVAVFDPAADTVVWTDSGGTITPATDQTGFWSSGAYAGKLTVKTSHSWAQAVVTVATHINSLGADALGIVLEDKGSTSDGYTSVAADNFVILENGAGTASTSLPIQVTGKVNQKGGTYFGWVDLSGVADAIKSDIKKITLRVGAKPAYGSTRFRVEKIAFGGIRYRDTAWSTASTANTEGTTYAYNVTEGSTIGQARTLVLTAASILGDRLNVGAPYMGATITVNAPRGDAPFTSGATIRLYRKVGSTYYQVATGPNSEELVFIDRLQDAAIIGDPVTYPATTLNFDAPTGSFSGQVSGVVCGCAWKGSNIYAGDDGKIYGSRSGIFDEVLWDDVVLTNDVGSSDLGPPRTLVLADDLRSPALCLVPGESLYALTERDVYVFIPGETFATSSFPRICDGARGVVGVRAATLYGDACLYGAMDGLWLVKKSTFDSNQPDLLEELTKDNRGAWQWLLGDSPSTLVVRQILGEVWCFNGTRYLHLTRESRTIKGEWADGRNVVDATSDPKRGLMLQLSDGSIALVGRFVSDGGADLEGTNGTVPTWFYESGVEFAPHGVVRGIVHAVVGATGRVAIEVQTERPGTTEIAIATEGERVASLAFPRTPGNGSLSSFRLSGGAADKVFSATIELTDRKASRALNSEVN